MIRFLLPLALVASAPAAAQGFDPVQFFEGSTYGDGQLKVMMKRSHRIHVESHGTRNADGSLLLTQRVQEQGKPERLRYWRLHRTGPTSFGGTLTDAAGPVTVQLTGKGALIRYRMKGGLDAQQQLTPRADGRTVDNRMTVRKVGMAVAHFSEVIRKR